MLGMPTPTPFDLHFRLLGIPVRVHPLFWLVGAAILALTALMALLRGRGRGGPREAGEEGRAEARRIAAGLGGGAIVAGAGLLALLPGPSPLAVDTSKDAFLRRAGLGGALRADYLDRFARHWARFALPLSVPPRRIHRDLETVVFAIPRSVRG